MRLLAQRAAEAAGQIRGLSAETASSIDQGAASVSDARATVNRLVETATGVARTIETVVDNHTQQSRVLSQIDVALAQVDAATQQNAALAEQLTAAAASLNGRAGELQSVMGHFVLGDTRPGDLTTRAGRQADTPPQTESSAPIT